MDINNFISKCDDMMIADESTSSTDSKNPKTKLSINCSINSELIKMLAWLEVLGGVGHSSGFKVFADGDGNCRYQLKFDNKEDQKSYDQIKKDLVKANIDTQEDIESFRFE